MATTTKKTLFYLLLSCCFLALAPLRAGEIQQQEFTLARTLVTDQVVKFNNCFDFNQLDRVFVENIQLEVNGIDKESFLELIIDGYPTGRSFDVRRGHQTITIDLPQGQNQIGVDFHEISLVVRGEVYIGDMILTLRVQGHTRPGGGYGGGYDHDRPHRPAPPNHTEITVDYLGRYLPGDVNLSMSEIIAGRGVYMHDYPSKVTFFVETESVSSISLCQRTSFTHECANQLLKRGRGQRVSFEVPGPFTIDALSVIGRGVIKLNKIVFHFVD